MVLPLAPPQAYRSQIWIDDAAAAVIAALGDAESGVYDVVEDQPFTQDQMIAALAAAVGRARLRRLPRLLLRFALRPDMRALLGRRQRVTAARFKEITGWRPEVPDQAEGWRRIAGAGEMAMAA